jgi:hypothetical protein
VCVSLWQLNPAEEEEEREEEEGVIRATRVAEPAS